LRLGAGRAVVVHGLDGIDEVSTIGKTRVARVDGGRVFVDEIEPGDFGAKKASPDQIRAGGTIEDNVRIALSVLAGKRKTPVDEARLELCAANAGAVFVVAGRAKDFESGFRKAVEVLESGAAFKKLEEIVAMGGDVEKLVLWKRKFGVA